jgi:hypothetical protein
MRIPTRWVGLAALVLATISCGDVVRTGRSPSYLVIDSLQGIRGSATAGTPASVLISDVITNVISPAPCAPTLPCPTIFGDSGQAVVHLALKDPGTSTSPTTPSQVNAVTISRVHVEYVRADGHNTPGLDVPYPIDGAVTVTITANASTFGFELVRVVAKEESPLVQLKNSNQFITALANVTFYGKDQAGNDVSVTGTIQIDFGNFGDS